jgi:hypothetical protein
VLVHAGRELAEEVAELDLGGAGRDDIGGAGDGRAAGQRLLAAGFDGACGRAGEQRERDDEERAAQRTVRRGPS